MNRYIDADQSVQEVFNEVVNERFPAYANLAFKFVFDTKKKMNKGALVLASVEVANEKVRFLTKDEAGDGEGYDYIMYFDNIAWENAGPEDRKRLVSHELNHVFIDEKGRLKIVDHDVQDFRAEIARNADDPEWGARLAAMTEAIHSQKEDQN